MKRQLRKLANYLADNLMAEDVVYACEDGLGALVDNFMADVMTADLNKDDPFSP